MSKTFGDLIGSALAEGARRLFSGGGAAVPDLCPTLAFVRGVPFGRCDSLVFRGEIDGISANPSDCAVVIHLLDGDSFLRSTDSRNADKDGDFVATSEILWDGRQARFEALVSADALGNVRSYRPLTVQVTAVNKAGTFSRSRFDIQRPSGLVGDGPTPTIGAFAWHMLLVARAGGRSLQRNDLKGMIKRVNDYFDLSPNGRRQFQEAVQEQVRSHQPIEGMIDLHSGVFDESLHLDQRIQKFLCDLILQEIIDHEDYHTLDHALILRSLWALCPDDDVRRDLRRFAEIIEEQIGAAAVDGANRDEERARHCEVLGVPPDASLEEIKRAYREAMKEVHPDLTRDLSPRQRKVLEQHARELNEAFEALTRGT